MDDLGSHLVEWPVTQTAKCLCFYHPDDPEDLRLAQERELKRAFDATRTVGRELLVEIIAGKHGALGPDTVASVIRRLYALGIRPDWWKLEPQADATAWARTEEAILANDRAAAASSCSAWMRRSRSWWRLSSRRRRRAGW